MNKRRQRRYIQYSLIILICTFLLISGCGKSAEEVVQEAAITVDTADVLEMNISKSVDYTGRVRASNEVAILPKTSARVTALHVEAGQKVNAGQLLISLDTSDLQVSIKQAEASLASAKAGQASNEINLEAARRNLERTQQLFDAGAASQLQLETARDQYESMQAGMVEASVAQAEAALLAVQKQLEYCAITTPVSGVVGRIDVSAGDTVSPQAAAAVVNDTREMEIELAISESDIASIVPDSEVDVLIKAASSDAFKGTIESIATISDPMSYMYPLIISLDNPDAIIKSGMFAEVGVSTEGVEGAVCIPLAAVIPDHGKNIVYMANDENRAQKVEVETGINDGVYIQISSGLKTGDKVVTRGNTLIDENTLLRITGGEGE